MSLKIDLTDRNALVTGASRGIGSAVADALAGAGANVAIHYRDDEAAAKKVARRVAKHERESVLLRANMASAQDIWQMFDLYDQKFGTLDLVVCNAGIWRRAPIDKVSEEEVREMFAVNLEGVIHTCRMAATRMMRQGRGGSIVLIGSTAGTRGEPYHAHYAASKGAIVALGQSLAVELADHKIRVNTVSPGWVNTDMTREALDGADGDRIRDSIPLGDAGSARDVAGPVLFLLSDLASYMTGATVDVNGGSVLR